MNDYMGTNQQHCACSTPAGTSNTTGGAGTSASITVGIPNYNAGISQGGTLPGDTTLSPSLMPGTAAMNSNQFLNGYLRSYIGRNVTVQFLFGTDTLTDRTGVLVNVGANYISIREFGSNNLLICDFFSIKIVRVYQS